MSNTENTSVESTEDDLDAFAAELFGQSEAAPEPASSEDDGELEEKSDAPEDTQTDDETDTLEAEDGETTNEDEDTDEPEEDETSEEPPVEKPKKKNRFQERIDEVVGKQREAERRAEELERKLQEALQRLEPNKNEKIETAPIKDDGAPSPDAKNEDGTDKYPLGEFDPSYIRDLTKYTIQQEREASKAAEQEAQRKAEEEVARKALEENWTSKMDSAQERYPDFQEKSENLVNSFGGLEPAYGEYLAATLMSMDHGPDVLYYLANNPDEASKIVQSGPTKATIALGRLEAKFVEAEAEKTLARPKTSKAPEPPTTRLKGSSAVIPEVPDDTDDLEAFERKLFGKGK